MQVSFFNLVPLIPDPRVGSSGQSSYCVDLESAWEKAALDDEDDSG